MWALLKSLLLKWALLKSLLRILASLGWLLPLGLLLKTIGIPLLIVLAVLAIPLFIVLAVIGLPLLLIVGVGGALLAFTLWLLSVGMLALKIVVPVVLVVWCLRWLRSDKSCTADADGDTPPA